MAEHPESRLERAAESTLAKAAARILVPLLISIVGTLLLVLASQVRADVAELRDVQNEQGRDIAIIKTRLDTQVLQQVQANTKNIEKIDERVQRIERRLGDP
jgi:hypothetical protein